MAHSKSAEKRTRQNAARRERNRSQRSALRTRLKKVAAAIEAGDVEAAKTEFAKACEELDRAARKGLIHKNHAARRKSRLAARVAGLGPG
jgi:small subunit ribosomal protein S20